MNYHLFLAVALTTTAFGKTIPNNAEADIVLGQQNFTSDLSPNPPNATSLNNPRSVVVDPVTRKVFVNDGGNHRILRYASADALASGAAAEVVFGNDVFTSAVFGAAVNRLSNAGGIFLDFKGRLWAADYGAHRVLMFEAACFRSSGNSADRVFGQPDFTTDTPGTTKAKMNIPFDICVDASDRLWVADGSNNRVLRFDNVTTKSSGADADGVLGQSNFTTGSIGVSAYNFRAPRGVTVSASGALYVTCAGASNVMRFDNAAGLANGAPATVVLGQPDFAAITPGTTATKMNTPIGA